MAHSTPGRHAEPAAPLNLRTARTPRARRLFERRPLPAQSILGATAVGDRWGESGGAAALPPIFN